MYTLLLQFIFMLVYFDSDLASQPRKEKKKTEAFFSARKKTFVVVLPFYVNE